MPINVMVKKQEFEAACKRAKKLAREKKCEYIVYWSDYETYRVIPRENLECYDDGTPFEPILFYAEP